MRAVFSTLCCCWESVATAPASECSVCVRWCLAGWWGIGRGFYQPDPSSLDRGWYWSAADIGGDSERLSNWEDHGLVVITCNWSNMLPHITRGHVKPSAKGIVNLGASILEDTLGVLNGRGDVHRGWYGILKVGQELFWGIEAGAGSKDVWARLCLSSKHRPDVGPDGVIEAFHTGCSETLVLIENERGPGFISFISLCNVVDMFSGPQATVCR